MSIYKTIDRKLLFPLAEKYMRRNICGEYELALERDMIPREDLLELQNKKLRELIEHCYKNVPYYKNLFNSLGLRPEDINDAKDLSKLPILTKEIIRQHYDELISIDISDRQSLQESTGGSTGTPMKYLGDINTWNRLRAVNYRMWHWAGFEFGDKLFTLAGNSLVAKKDGKKRRLGKKDFYDRVLMRNNKHDCTDISDTAMEEHYKDMMRYKPKAIRGYASSLYFLAKYIERNKLKSPDVVAVFTTGEKLHSKYRYTLQKVFGVPVFDGYGAQDGGINAHECYMHEGLHISEENCIVEICDINGNPLPDGETGNVITTDLNNYCFPFIRYKVGDLAYVKPELCSCGRGSRLLGEVIGREGRAIFNKQGRPFSSIVIDNMMFPNLDIHSEESQRTYEKMAKFQIRQDTNGDLNILIVPATEVTDFSVYDYIKDNFSKYFPESKIEISIVDQIPPLPSGKEDYCVSEYRPESTR